MEPFPRYVHPLPEVTTATESLHSNGSSKAPETVVVAVTVQAELNDTSSPWIFGEVEDTVILPILLSLIALLCWTANLLLLYGVLSRPKLRSGFNLMLVNISVCDLIFISLCVPTAIINHATYGALLEPPGAQVCKFVHYVTFVTVYVAIYTMVVTCVFRFFGEYMSDKGKSVSYLSLGNGLLSCAVIWFAFIMSHINFLIQQDVAIFQEPFICIHSDTMMETAKLKTLWVTFLACAFLIPLVAVAVLSGIILTKRHPDEDRAAFPLNHRMALTEVLSTDTRTKRERTLLIMSATVVRTLCWVPIQIFVMVDVFGYTHSDELYRKAEMLSVCVAFLGSFMSPVVYYFASTEIKNCYRELFTKMGCSGCTPVNVEDQGSDMNETIMSIISDSSNHINYQA